MFERFDEPAHRILGVAYLQARRSGQEAIGLEHLLIGLAEEAPHLLGRPPHALRPNSVGMEETQDHDDRHIPFTADARAALEQAIAEADALHQQAVVPAHLLLALLRDPGARRTLEASGVSLEALEEAAVLDSRPQVRSPSDAAVEAALRAGDPVEVTLASIPIGDLGNGHTDARVLAAMLVADGRSAELLRRHGVDEQVIRALHDSAH